MKTPREILLKRHQAVEPKLDRIWTEAIAPELLSWRATLRRGRRNVTDTILRGSAQAPRVPPANVLWRELIWPCRHVWAGVACAWLLIIGLNMASFERAPRVASKTEPRSGEELRAFIEQRQLLAQLTDALPEPADTRKPNPPGPRSDRGARISAA